MEERRSSFGVGTNNGSSSPERSNKTSALKWFEAHPLVATLLWVLGADVEEQADEKASGKKSKPAVNRSLSWRDDRGGSIIVENDRVGSGKTRFTDSSVLYSGGSSNEDIQAGVMLKRNTVQYQERDSDSRESFGTDSPNNNYGFYVTISPPQEHKFPRVPRDDVDVDM
jgi:hypothetical protein